LEARGASTRSIDGWDAMHPTVVVFPRFCIVLTQWRNVKKVLVGSLQGQSALTSKKVCENHTHIIFKE